MKIRNTTFSALAILSMPLLAQGGDLNTLSGAYQQAMNAQVTCADPMYSTPTGASMRAACTTCQQSVEQAKNTIRSAYPNAVSASTAADSQGVANAAKNASNTTGVQNTNMSGAGTGFGNAAAGLGTKAAQAGNVSAAAKQCVQILQGQCSGVAPSDGQAAQQVMSGCESLGSGADTVAAEKAGGGMDMGQLAGAAGQLAGALGPLAQMLMGQDQAATTPPVTAADLDKSKDKTADPYAAPSTVALDSVNPSNTSLDAIRPITSDIAGIPTVESPAMTSSGSTMANRGDKGKNPFAANSSKLDGSPYMAGPSVGGSAGGFGGGSGSGDSSGASKMPEGLLAKMGDGGYEISSAGGGGRSGFLGLKSRGNELGDLTDGAGSVQFGGLDALGSDERGPASLGAAAEQEQAWDEASIFQAVKSKYVEIVRRGNI